MSNATNSTDVDDLELLYSQLRLSISAPRIERRAGRSRGKWDSEKSLVQVIRKEGKFETYGRYIGNKLYLEYYEALYLLELGRLQINKDGLTLSIEQAYLLLLGEQPTPKFNEYLVYSCLTRAGYILQNHRNKFFRQTFMQAPTETECIWAWLANTVENRTIPNYIKKTEIFAKVKQQIEGIKSTIIQQKDGKITQATDEDPTANCTTSKRPKLDNVEQSEQKKEAIWPMDEGKSFLDFLMSEPEFKQFEKTFKKFDVIKLKTSKSQGETSNNSSDNDDENDLHIRKTFSINFDLYLHNNGFKKSAQMPPVMRVLILDSKQSFPSHAEISQCSRDLLYATPLLIVSVGDAKQIQAFLYLFT